MNETGTTPATVNIRLNVTANEANLIKRILKLYLPVASKHEKENIDGYLSLIDFAIKKASKARLSEKAKRTEIIAQLRFCAEAITEEQNATAFKGCLIDAESHIQNAIEHIERHARNEAARAAAR